MTGHDELAAASHEAEVASGRPGRARRDLGRSLRERRFLRNPFLWCAVVVAGTVGCLLAGLPAGLPAAVVLLWLAVRHPLAGLLYAVVVFAVPLGLWLLGVRTFVGWALGGEFMLDLSAAVVVGVLAAAAVLRRGLDLPVRWLVAGGAGLVVALVWGGIGIAHHGWAQTLTGLRVMLLPIALFVVVAHLDRSAVLRAVTVLSWLLTANALASAIELLIGPDRLVTLGFSEDVAVRYIDGVFRVPGLTEFNAELGMLAGAYLLGYIACWLTPGAPPRHWSWHVGAVSSAVCLALSTSRSGALLVVAGVLGAVVFYRSQDRVRRWVSLFAATGSVAAIAVLFVVLGAAGTTSLFQRFAIWGNLLDGVPVLGYGIGSAGAATYSRVATTGPVFVDNYFVSIGLQCGLAVMVLVTGGVIALLVILIRRSTAVPGHATSIALLCGLAASSLVIDSWEFPAAIVTMALFHAYALNGGAGTDPGRDGSPIVARQGTGRHRPGAGRWGAR